MKLILFLGSGVSLKSGLPTVDDLTKAIFTEAYHQDGYNYFGAGAVSDSNVDDATPRIRRLLRLLKDHDERDIKRVGYSPSMNRSSGAIFRNDESTYEDLFYLCEQMRLWSLGLVDNSLVTPLMEVIERNSGDLLAGDSTIARISDLGSLAQLACFFIESVVAEELNPKCIVGLDLILELSSTPYLEQLSIVTLNHDTLVEQFLEKNKIDFIDGFGEQDGDVRWYEDSVYDAPSPTVRLFKLHGSIDWYSFQVEGRLKSAIVRGDAAKTIVDAKGAHLKQQYRRPSFLSGISKAVAYQRGIYADMHFRFHRLLRECKQILMSGYGWGDGAMNFRLDTWLDHDRHNSIILLHETPDKLVDRSLVMAVGYDGWTRCGQLIPLPKWLSDTSLSDIEKHFMGKQVC